MGKIDSIMSAKKKNIFLICPVRGATDEETKLINHYVSDLEAQGHTVHWPPRNTNQVDPIGLRICQDNRDAIEKADEIHIWWNSTSKGSLFDLGMVFALRKKLVIANKSSVQKTEGKSFENVVLAYAEE